MVLHFHGPLTKLFSLYFQHLKEKERERQKIKNILENKTKQKDKHRSARQTIIQVQLQAKFSYMTLRSEPVHFGSPVE